MLVDPSDLDWILPQVRETLVAFFPASCILTRITAAGASSAPAVPCRVVPNTRQLYPFNAIPDQALQRWDVHLPAGVDARPNDILTLADGRVFVVVYTSEPGAYRTREVAICVLSALDGGALASAYLRPNATVVCTRPGLVSDSRRVHLTFPQANPSAPLERVQGGAVSLRATFFDLPDADWTQGDGFTIEQTDGVSPFTRLDVATFTVQGVLRRPLPYTILEADLVAPIA